MSKNFILCIVDDDDIYKYTVRRHLQNFELAKQVLFFSDGEEAMDFLTENLGSATTLPDVIFLDINMPIMNGFEFMEHFVQLKPRLGKQIVVYMVSSSVDPIDIERAKKISEISDYIVKPINQVQLRALISELSSRP